MDNPVPIPHMTLHLDDVTELWPEATEAELTEIAGLISDGLMQSWSDALEEAVDFVRRDKKPE